MNGMKSIRLMALAAAPLLVLSTGCVATRKFVRNTTDPLQTRIGSVDKKVDEKTSQNAQDIKSLDEKTEAGISEARNSADQANQAAGQADQHAQAASQLAEKGVSAANKAQETADNIDNYQPSQRAAILFGFNKAALTDADKQQLDQLAQSVTSLKHYVIQIQGYTDKTGSKEYNLQLSQKRANAVIRYLTMDRSIPLVRIYSMGYGESAPAAPNATRKGRELNRRVDLTVMVPQMSASAQQQGAGEGQTSADMNQ
ncbi:MAG TPA: OmpA family protein [Terriglobia bacterium]|nr:OmpA family protein [Terriglobia bacterium]